MLRLGSIPGTAMTAVHEVELREVVGCLAATHERAASAYREMAAGPGTAAAVRLLGRLARREGLLARQTAVFASRVDGRVRVLETVPALAASAPPSRIDAGIVIDRAVQIETVIEKLLRIAMTPPIADSPAMAELCALHRRELFGLGTAAARLREHLE